MELLKHLTHSTLDCNGTWRFLHLIHFWGDKPSHDNAFQSSVKIVLHHDKTTLLRPQSNRTLEKFSYAKTILPMGGGDSTESVTPKLWFPNILVIDDSLHI